MVSKDGVLQGNRGGVARFPCEFLPSCVRVSWVGFVGIGGSFPRTGSLGAMCDVPVDDPVRQLRDAELDGSGFARFSPVVTLLDPVGWKVPWKDSAVSFLWTWRSRGGLSRSRGCT